MNSLRITINLLAFFSMFFVNLIIAEAQVDSVAGIYQLPAGTKILVKMDNEINSKVSGVNDTFTATIAEPVTVRNTVVLPIGAVVEGRITKVKRASTGRSDGDLKVVFEILRLKDGENRPIKGILVKELRAKHSQTASALTIIGATAIGGLLGAVSKAGNGALIGAGIGLGAGTGIALLKKGEEVRIVADQKFEIEITKEVQLPVKDY